MQSVGFLQENLKILVCDNKSQFVQGLSQKQNLSAATQRGINLCTASRPELHCSALLSLLDLALALKMSVQKSVP